MTTTISMPQLGETVTEGTILRWAKQVGDAISQGEVVLEISTDKVDTEIPSPVSGVMLEILVSEGETVEVGRDLCVVGDPEGSVQEESPDTQAAEPLPESPPPDAEDEPPASQGKPPRLPPTPPAGGRPGPSRRLSPVVRRLVRQHGIDIGLIAGTGEGGRVTRRDVEAYLEGGVTPAPAAPTPEPPAGAPAPTAPPGGEERVDLSRLRVRIGENMIRSRQTAAHVWTSVEVDFERIAEVRTAHKGRFRREEGFSLTYLPFVCRAVIDALRVYPVVNSSFYLEDRKAVYHSRIDLGIAVDLDQQGLVVVTIRDADNLRLVGLARRIRHLSTAARSRQLGPDQMTGSTFTITNPGPFDSFLSAPIINVPNVAILSTDTVAKRPVVVTTADGRDALAIRHIGYLGFSWDHRAFDGSTAVLFLQRIKNNLETWDWEQELK
ncbi:MAG: dihydrolipoamide acetyltransferase family protein [bacterium]|nr:dihydrolipoamide acetyltransferase family protein [bacterium]